MFFFRAGELTVPTQAAFDSAVHLAWGDIAADEGQPPTIVRYFFKRSKTDQFGQGMAVFMGATGSELCPVRATITFVAVRGDAPGPFFCFEDGTALTKAQFVTQVRDALDHAPYTPVTASILGQQRRRLEQASRTRPFKPLGDGPARPFCATFGPCRTCWHSTCGP